MGATGGKTWPCRVGDAGTTRLLPVPASPCGAGTGRTGSVAEGMGEGEEAGGNCLGSGIAAGTSRWLDREQLFPAKAPRCADTECFFVFGFYPGGWWLAVFSSPFVYQPQAVIYVFLGTRSVSGSVNNPPSPYGWWMEVQLCLSHLDPAAGSGGSRGWFWSPPGRPAPSLAGHKLCLQRHEQNLLFAMPRCIPAGSGSAAPGAWSAADPTQMGAEKSRMHRLDTPRFSNLLE